MRQANVNKNVVCRLFVRHSERQKTRDIEGNFVAVHSQPFGQRDMRKLKVVVVEGPIFFVCILYIGPKDDEATARLKHTQNFPQNDVASLFVRQVF